MFSFIVNIELTLVVYFIQHEGWEDGYECASVFFSENIFVINILQTILASIYFLQRQRRKKLVIPQVLPRTMPLCNPHKICIFLRILILWFLLHMCQLQQACEGQWLFSRHNGNNNIRKLQWMQLVPRTKLPGADLTLLHMSYITMNKLISFFMTRFLHLQNRYNNKLDWHGF